MSLENPFGPLGNVPDPITPKPPEKRTVASIRSEQPRGAGKRKAIRQEMEEVELLAEEEKNQRSFYEEEESIQRSYGELFRSRKPEEAFDLFRKTGVEVDLDFVVQNAYGVECTLRNLIWDELWGYTEDDRYYDDDYDDEEVVVVDEWPGRVTRAEWERILPWLSSLGGPSQVRQLAEHELGGLLAAAKQDGLVELAREISSIAGFPIEKGFNEQVEAAHQKQCAQLLRSGKWLALLRAREARGKSFDFEPALKKVAQEVAAEARSRYPKAVAGVLEDILLPAPEGPDARRQSEAAREHGPAIMAALHLFEQEEKGDLPTFLRHHLTPPEEAALPQFFAHPGEQEPYLRSWLEEVLKGELPDILRGLSQVGFSWRGHLPVVRSIWERQVKGVTPTASTLAVFPEWDREASYKIFAKPLRNDHVLNSTQAKRLGRQLLVYLTMDSSLGKDEATQRDVQQLYRGVIAGGGSLDREPYISLQKLFPPDRDLLERSLTPFFLRELNKGSFKRVLEVVKELGILPPKNNAGLEAARRGFVALLMNAILYGGADLGGLTKQMKEMEELMDCQLTDLTRESIKSLTSFIIGHPPKKMIRTLGKVKDFFRQNGRILEFDVPPMVTMIEDWSLHHASSPDEQNYKLLEQLKQSLGFDWQHSTRLTGEMRRSIFSQNVRDLSQLISKISEYKAHNPGPFQLTPTEEKSFQDILKDDYKYHYHSGNIYQKFEQTLPLRALIDGPLDLEPIRQWFLEVDAPLFFKSVLADPKSESIRAYNLLFHRDAEEDVKSTEFCGMVVQGAIKFDDYLPLLKEHSTQLGLDDADRRTEFARRLYHALPERGAHLWEYLQRMQAAGFDHDDPALEGDVRHAIMIAARYPDFIFNALKYGWLLRAYTLAPERVQKSVYEGIMSHDFGMPGLWREEVGQVIRKLPWKGEERTALQTKLLRDGIISPTRYQQLRELEEILGFPIVRTLTEGERIRWYSSFAQALPPSHEGYLDGALEALGLNLRDEALHTAVVNRVLGVRTSLSFETIEATVTWLVKNGYPQEKADRMVMEVMATFCDSSQFIKFFALKKRFGVEPPRERTEPALRARVLQLLLEGNEKVLAEFVKDSGISVDQAMVAQALIKHLASGQLPETFLTIVRQYGLRVEMSLEAFAADRLTPRSAALVATYFLPVEKAARSQALQNLVNHGPEWRRVLPELLQLQGPAARQEFCGWATQLPQLLTKLESQEPGYGKGLVEFVKRFGMANLPKLACTVVELKRILDAEGTPPRMNYEVMKGLEDFRTAHGLGWSVADIQANPKTAERALDDLTQACRTIERAISDDRIPDALEASPLEMELFHALFPTSGTYHTYAEREKLIGRWRETVEQAKRQGKEASCSVPPGYEQREYTFQPLGSDIGNLMAQLSDGVGGETDEVKLALEKKREALLHERQAIWMDEPMRTFLAPFEEALRELVERPMVQIRPQEAIATVVERIERALGGARESLERLSADTPKPKRAGMERSVAALEADAARFRRLLEPGGDEEALSAERQRIIVAIREKREEFDRSREQGTWSEDERKTKEVSLDDWERGQRAKLQGLHELMEDGLAGKTAEQREYGRIQRVLEALRIASGKRALEVAGPELRMLSLELMRHESPGHIEAVREAERATENREQRLFESWATLFREELVEHFFNEGHQHPEVRQHPFSRELGQLLESVWRINGIKDKLRLPTDKKQESTKPVHPLFDQIRKDASLAQRMEALERAASGQGEGGEGERIRFLPVHGLGRILASDISNACYNKYNGGLAQNEYPRLNAVLYQKEGQKGGYLGATLLIEAEESETPARCLVIRALNPTDAVIKRQFSADQFVATTIEYAIETAKNRGLDKVLLCFDHSGGHATNRDEVFKAEGELINRRGYRDGPVLKQTPETNFNGYTIWREGETRIVWDRMQETKEV